MKNHYYINGYMTISENYKDIISVRKTEGDDRFFHFHLRPSKGQYSKDKHSGIYITIGNPSDYIVYKNVTYKGDVSADTLKQAVEAQGYKVKD